MDNQQPLGAGRVAVGVYESHTVAIDPGYRYRRMIGATIVFLLLGWGMIAAMGTDFITAMWPLLVFVYVLPYLGYIVYFVRHTHEVALTKDGMIAKAQDESAAEVAGRARQLESDAAWERRLGPLWVALDKAVVRYPLGAIVLLLAFQLSTSESLDKNTVILAIALWAVALWLMRELLMWVIGLTALAGIGSLLFGVVASLPVSVAIIIGAWIIASSSRK